MLQIILKKLQYQRRKLIKAEYINSNIDTEAHNKKQITLKKNFELKQ